MRAIEERLVELWERPGFWRERWRSAGLARAPLRLEELPIVKPEELADDERSRPPYGTWRSASPVVRVGWPVVERPLEAVFFTTEDLTREAAAGARALATAGLAAGTRETNTLPGGLATPGSLIVGDAAQQLGALDMPVGSLATRAARDTAFDFWSRVRPDFAVLDESGAHDLRTLLDERATDAARVGLRAAAIVTDLRDPEPSLPELGISLTRIVGLPEAFGLLAARGADGVYVPPREEVWAEVIDGELVLTTLHHSAALVRYAPGVRARMAPDKAAEPGSPAGFVLA
jgi:phenylacetate-coenzyme A ligase PaaK-like adenylate-forming protein